MNILFKNKKGFKVVVFWVFCLQLARFCFPYPEKNGSHSRNVTILRACFEISEARESDLLNKYEEFLEMLRKILE